MYITWANYITWTKFCESINLQELSKRGIAKVVVDDAVDAVFGDKGISMKRYLEEEAAEDEKAMWSPEGTPEAALLDTVRRLYQTYGSRISKEAKRRRLGGWLQRRGFSWDDISRVIKKIESE